MNNEPPLGLTPKYVWDEHRIWDIWNAIYRFIDAKEAIPLTWVEEYNMLVGKEKEND